MSSTTRPCKFCNPQVDIVPNPDLTGKWHPLNLDGTPHKHNVPYTPEFPPRSSQGQAMRKAYPDTAPPTTDPQDDEAYDQKWLVSKEPSKSTMEIMHNENVAAWTAQTESTNKLSTAIDMLTAAISKSNQLKEMDNLSNATKNKEPNWIGEQ